MNPTDHPTGAQAEVAGRNQSPNRRLGRRYLLAGIAALGTAGAVGARRTTALDTLEPGWDDVDRANPVLSRYGDWDDDDDDYFEWDDDDFRDNEASGAVYQDFVTRLATNLGETDATAVDGAIRSSLTAMIEERFTNGDISRNQADDVTAWIESSHVPVAALMVAGMRDRSTPTA